MSEPTPEPPTPVTVCAEMRRPQFTSSMFDDLLPDGAWLASYVMGKPCWTVTFESTAPGPALDEATAGAVWARMESTDDVDQVRRANLRALRDAAELATFDAEGFETVRSAVIDACHTGEHDPASDTRSGAYPRSGARGDRGSGCQGNCCHQCSTA